MISRSEQRVSHIVLVQSALLCMTEDPGVNCINNISSVSEPEPADLSSQSSIVQSLLQSLLWRMFSTNVTKIMNLLDILDVDIELDT